MYKDIQNFSLAESEARQQVTQVILAVAPDFTEELLDIDYPPETKLGDYCVPCFVLATKRKKPPMQIAVEIAQQIQPQGMIIKAMPAGPYVNFFIDKKIYNEAVLKQIAKQKEKYGSSKIGKGKKVMVEYFSPNTNKPLTIGHLRNICLGFSIARLLEFTGHKVYETTIYNDRGIAIAKAILGYKKWGNKKTPQQAKMKPDHFVGKFYVKAAQAETKDPNIEAESKRILQAHEEGKKEVTAIWQKLQGWVLEGFEQTLRRLGITHFDEKYYESEFYTQGKEIAQKGLTAGIFEKDKEGVITARLQKYGLPNKILLRPDGTSLYITQDLYLAKLKDKHKLDSSIYVVGSEQELYFKQLFKILELLGFEHAKNYVHLSYGMVRLPDGKIKSREGLKAGTGADDLLNQLQGMAILQIQKRSKNLDKKELEHRAEQISLAALKYYILATSPKTTMVFDPNKSLSFTGQTGPYLQYVYARINSIFAKANTKVNARVDYSLFATAEEIELIKALAHFPVVVEKAVKQHDPSEVSQYLYSLAKTFSVFYEKVPILTAEAKTQKARLLLVDCVQTVLGNGLKLLGIPTPEKM